MKKFAVLIFISTMFFSSNLSAQVEFEQLKSNTSEKLTFTGFDNYYPFGDFDDYGNHQSVFDEFLNEFAEIGQYVLYNEGIVGTYTDNIREASKGKVDIVLGMYSESSLYVELKYIYPAAIDNPIHIVMLPSRIHELTSLDELKKMRGAVHADEHFSDYVKNQLKSYNVEYVDNSEDLFGKLILGEIDYIFTSLYFGTVEASKLGVRNQIAFSKKALWTMPIFVGISKMSFHREFLSQMLSQYLTNPANREKIKNRMIELVKQAELDNAGVVPPTYIKEEKSEQLFDK